MKRLVQLSLTIVLLVGIVLFVTMISHPKSIFDEGNVKWISLNEQIENMLSSELYLAEVEPLTDLQPNESDKFMSEHQSEIPDTPRPIVNLNESTLSELQTLPGIGEVKAKAIIEYRDHFGRFEHVEELIYVKGIGEKTLEKLKDLIEVTSD